MTQITPEKRQILIAHRDSLIHESNTLLTQRNSIDRRIAEIEKSKEPLIKNSKLLSDKINTIDAEIEEIQAQLHPDNPDMSFTHTPEDNS